MQSRTVEALFRVGVTTVSLMAVGYRVCGGIVIGLRYHGAEGASQLLYIFKLNAESIPNMANYIESGGRLWRVLVVHNRYQHAGGEDSVVASEIDLLRSYGHTVKRYDRDNSEVESLGKVSLAAQTVWSRRTTRDLARDFLEFRPDVVHVHNTFPLISPSVYWLANRQRVPVVQTIHNFRLLCLQAMFLRNGHVCEDCIGHSLWRGVVRKCYRGSYLASAAAGFAMQVHRFAGTFRDKINMYVALNSFCRDKLVAGGLPANRIRIKPNFIASLPVGPEERTGNPLFVGRLSEEKGVGLLANVARHLGARTVIDVVGSGPQAGELSGVAGLRMLGAQPPERVYELMRNAPFLIMPSIWYENMPRTLVEAYACGTPVIASRLGALAELVDHRVSGLLFSSGSGDELARMAEWAISHPQEMRIMGKAARRIYEFNYTPEANYEMLTAIYADALHDRQIG